MGKLNLYFNEVDLLMNAGILMHKIGRDKFLEVRGGVNYLYLIVRLLAFCKSCGGRPL